MKMEEEKYNPNMLDEPVIFVPDEILRNFKQTLWKMEISLLEFAKVAREMKPIEK